VPEVEATSSPSVSSDLTVATLIDRLAHTIQRAFSNALWVVGEVQSRRERNGHIYFQLADPKDGSSSSATLTVNASLWADTARHLATRLGGDTLDSLLQDGMKVRLLAQVTLYRDRAQISLNIQDIDPVYTRGALALQREALLRELAAQNLDEAQRRLPLPPFPFRLGLISAPNSRAESDTRDQLLSRGYVSVFGGEILFEPASTQGESTPLEIEAAIGRLIASQVDLILVTRGGGSAADLRWFDDPKIAYAIARCPIPIVAAIGHHDDTCVAEMIAHRREKTPTAAADFVIDILQNTRERVEAAGATLAGFLTRKAEAAINLQALLSERLFRVASEGLTRRLQHLTQQATQLATLSTRQTAEAQRLLDRRANEIHLAVTANLTRRLETLVPLDRALAVKDPRSRLQDGWTILSSTRGRVRSIHDVSQGERLEARLLDGHLTLDIAALTPLPPKTTMEKPQ
jgi:exodeoxyribonuclease VII large subunit